MIIIGHSSCSLLAAALCVLLMVGTAAFAPSRGLPSSTCRGSLCFPPLPSPLSSIMESSPVGVNGSHDSSPTTTEPAASAITTPKKVAILLCPAQFCVPADYSSFLASIKCSPHLPPNTCVVASRVAPLPRTEWIKVAKQLPTKKFIDATLDVQVTLDWYFDAIEEALAELFAQAGEDVEICLVGHSIGGWVARAYLGGLSGSSTAVHRLTKERITSLVTLGTPHISPSSALIDQTRGLLRQIASSPSCSSQSLTDRGVQITCVSSSGLQGNIFTTELEQIVAATSYLPLTGKYNTKGDGIVPTDLAFMEPPARKVEIQQCFKTKSPVRHAHVLPTPWNLVDGSAASWSLPDEFVWYGSEGVLSQWLPYVSLTYKD
ncbi:hypothetical protein HJC23_013070 [Cyclotella cryptica]|uniref:GPI inositol-deacylase n=1 Tax=Cyclotella cryptica TaxID=29204 RepID=A0ABD3Q6F7_9STRA